MFTLRTNIQTLFFLPLLLGALPAIGAQKVVQDAPSAIPAETYRLRVENALHGRVEISLDGGAHYLLIGRVRRPATAPSLDKTAKQAGQALRSSADGLAFAIAPDEALKLRPHAPSAPSKPTRNGRKIPPPVFPAGETSAMITSLDAGQGPFGDLRILPATPVRLEVGDHGLAPLPEGFSLSDEDVFVFLVSLPLPAPAANAPQVSEDQRRADWLATVKTRVEALSQGYASGAVARARAEKRTIVSGTLTLHAKLPTGEPDPITAVTYLVDGQMVAVQNTPPYSFAWDTKQAPDGEHVVEIRAMNSRATLVTRARSLVVVQNGTPIATH